MSVSDEYGINDDDTVFLAAATQIEASQAADFATSPRPRKRRRVRGPAQLDGAGSEELDWSASEDERPQSQLAVNHFRARPQIRDDARDEIDDDNEPEEDPSYYFPGEQGHEDGEQIQKQSKYKIHIPKNGGLLPDLYLSQTQAGLDHDDGNVIRGAVWKKPKPPPPPLFNASAGRPPAAAALPPLRGLDAFVQRQQLPARPNLPTEDDGALARRLQAEENARPAARPPLAKSNSTNASVFADFTQDLADLPSDAFSSSSPEKSQEVITIFSQTGSQFVAGGLRGPQTGLKQMTIFGKPATQAMTASQAAKKKHAWPVKTREEPPTHHKLEAKEMQTWVYPTNLGTMRDYQFNIVSRSLFHNTLVALPTGLGKTFIAATAMLNWWRWTTNAQIIFMAPTKPLIAQQMEACYGIAGIARKDTVLMTGETGPAIRAEEWLEKRVFFMTPQTVINDLKTGICDPKRIVMVVVDEAHKATGGYAYTEVVTFLRRFNTSFRVLALTATPGNKVEAVQAVIDNLGIARVELRTEESLDIRQYTYEKHTEKEIFEYNEEQQLIMEHMSKALQPVLDKLTQNNAYWSRDPMALTLFGMNQSRQKWVVSDAGRKAPQWQKAQVNTIFTVLAGLAHNIMLLKFHGIAPFYTKSLEYQRTVTSGETKGKYAKQITESENWVKAMSYMRTWTNDPDFLGHPKLQYLREVVMNHFLDAGDGQPGVRSSTRIMIFASYRDSTQDICRTLKRNEPMIRPTEFVGQSNTKGSEGMNQKKQNEVIQDFKSGKFNVLVATSIGEEGLDIGDVDLIICYDTSSSPIRMLQRVGRTGRKRTGKVVLLLMKGKEENDFLKAKDGYSYIQKTIADDSRYAYCDDQSTRILPKDVQPVVDKRIVDIPPENSQPVDLSEKNRKRKGKGRAPKRPPKKFHMPDNVPTGFMSARKLASDTEESEAEFPAPKIKPKPAGKKALAKMKRKTASPEPEPAQIPFLDDVLLTADQQRELERRYARTSDVTGNDIVQATDPSRFPDSMRTLGETRYVGHGRAAMSVSKALQAVRDIEQTRVDRMARLLNKHDLIDLTGMRARLVSPVESEDELPTLPVRAAPKPKDKKSRAKPGKKKPLARTVSYGSAAMEGDESEPEPTPADMRLAMTQGIDLGSRDTSGEEDDEEPDSELENFVVGSDQPIEMASSSAPVTPAPKQKVKTKSKMAKEVGSENEDTPRPAQDVVMVDGEDEGEDVAVSSAVVAAGRKRRRIVQESDDE